MLTKISHHDGIWVHAQWLYTLVTSAPDGDK